jgi:hypothetical protein
MRLRRQPAPQTRRQKLRLDDLAKPPSTFAYRARRSDQERGTGRQLDREQTMAAGRDLGRFWLQRFGLIILLLAIVASLANIFTLSSSVKVVMLTTPSDRLLLRSARTYQAAASQQLADSIWNRNKITIDASKLSRQMLSQFPELSSVSVTVPLLAHRPLVYVEPAQPALILAAGNGAFIIDTTGKALIGGSSAAALGQANKLPVVTDQSGLDVHTNHQVLSAANVSFIQTVIAELAAKQVTVSGMTLPPAASELDVQLAGQAYFVKFNLQSNDPRGQAGTFLATIAQLHSQNITPAKYVDVRVDGRAYYQ